MCGRRSNWRMMAKASSRWECEQAKAGGERMRIGNRSGGGVRRLGERAGERAGELESERRRRSGGAGGEGNNVGVEAVKSHLQVVCLDAVLRPRCRCLATHNGCWRAWHVVGAPSRPG